MRPIRLLAACLIAALLAQPAGAGPLWRTANPLMKQKPVEIAAQGVVLRLDPATQMVGEGEDAFEAGRIDATVRFPGAPAFAVPADESRIDAHGVWLGIGKLNRRDADPVVILQGYSGGAHCCMTFQMAIRHAGQVKLVTLPMKDGEPDRRFPSDVDGDGTADFLRADDSFLYAFSSYAGSWSVPQVWNLRDGEMVDVSREARFAGVYRAFAARTAKACRKGGNGACASHAAAMARLGKAAEGIAFAEAHATQGDWYPADCMVETGADGECPEGQERQFANFGESLRWFLKQQGYLD